jgi:uroporphyrinogen decarboxylase
LSFFEFSENAELSAAASLAPRRFGVDGIILFYDITTLAVAMGQRFELVPKRGPVPDRPIRTRADVDALSSSPDPETYRHVLEILSLVKRELAGSLPILVFAGAPFTMAAYQTGLGKDLAGLRKFIADEPTVWSALLEKTSEATIGFLKTVLNAGADAYQLFDSWAGGLSRQEYTAHCLVHHTAILAGVRGPSILFVKDLPYLDLADHANPTAISLGATHDLAAAKAEYPHRVFQGNVDHMLLVHGTADEVASATKACLASGGGHRHILNLDHGMDPAAMVENFEAFIRAGKG